MLEQLGAARGARRSSGSRRVGGGGGAAPQLTGLADELFEDVVIVVDAAAECRPEAAATVPPSWRRRLPP